MKNKTLLRILSIGLLVAFGLQDLAWAEGVSGGVSWPAARKNGPIHLSKTLASSSRGSEGRSDWKVIHIQDAHDSLEAQKKIGGILETLVSEYDIRSVALEGSGGDIDPSLFRTYPDKEWAERSAGKLVEEGKLNAGEFFAITSKKPVSVYGVEERTLYRENLKAFRDLLLNKEKIERDLKGLAKTLETLSERVYSEKIKWIRAHSLFSDTSSLSFPKKWEAFESLAKEKNVDLRSYPSLSLLAGAAALEDRIDFKRANQERETLFSELKSALKGAELEALLERSVRFKAGEISDLEFYQFLSALAQSSSSDSARYPNLIAYIEYLQYFDTLDLADVLKEFEVFETSLKDAFFASEDERVLHRLERECHLITNLLSGSATSAEFERFKREFSRARFALLQKEVLGLTSKYSVPLYEGFEFKRLESSLPKAVRFYTLAKKRDAVLLRNTLKRMRKDGQRVAALVTGGFHAEGISELLKKNELSYLVVLPSVEDPSKKRPYMTILTRRRGQYEKELAGPASRYKVVLGTGLDTALANPYAKAEELLEPLVDGLRSAGQNAGARLARWMDDYEKMSRENKIRHSKALEPRNVRKSLEKMLGRHGEKRPEATRGARLAQARDFIAENKINFDPRFNYRILKLAEKDPKDWTEDENKEYEALRKEIEEAHDWTRQEISRYPSLIGHPPALLSLEGIVSAVERGKGPRLTSYHGGLGVLFGEWIRGIAYLGGVTTFDADSKAPEFHIFIPDYEEGVTTSRVHAFGYPTLGARQIQRPQDHGIDFMKDPKDPSQPFQISIPLYDSGESIYIRFRTVKIGALNLIMPATDFEANHPAVRRIFEELYKGKPSSRERFEQEWVAGLAAFEFRKKMGIPLDGPVHLNETATFPYLIGLIRHYMEEGYSYEDSLKLVGSQLVFFTHTLVAAGIDHFHEDGVKMGHYIRSYFEKSSSEEVRKQAGNVARDMIHGRRSEDGKLYLPGFEESHRRNVYSPLHFVVRLAHSFNGTVVAVSQLNAIEAGKFFIQQGIITPEENLKKPVLGITNGVDHLFWMIREVRDVMNWQESDPTKRTPERILDPDDPEARRLAALFDRVKEFGSIGEEPVMKDEMLFEKLYENKKLAVEMVRNTVRDQYIRETGIIEEATRQNHVTHEERERLHVLRVRWAHWIGKENPEEWVKSWEGRPFEEQEPFRKELHDGDLKNLMDPDLFLGVWARRIVNYKRILFTIFGHFLPEVEAQMPPDHALSPKELDDIILRLKNKGALNQFVELVVKKKTQFIFAGKAFSEDGRSSVALVHRLIELLSKEHPEFQDRVLFLEGYDETKSQYLVRGADTWINTPKRPLEASGTSGMKVAKGDIYSSPNGDGWGAGGIEDKLNGRVKGIVGTHQDHPDTWPASERENASNVSYYLGQEAAHFYEMMSEEVDRYNKAMAYFLKKDEAQRFNAVEWLQQIRRWMYFTALVYDIRGEFTGRRVPSFRPEDVPGGDERGIFSLYEEAIAKTQALKKSIAAEKDKQGARLAGLYENPILEEINREKALYNNQDNSKKLSDRVRELVPDYEKVTRLVYPASLFDDATVVSLLRVFPNIQEIFVVDFFGIPNYDLTDDRSRLTNERKKAELQKMWSDNLDRSLKGFEIDKKDLKLHVIINDYYRTSEIAAKKALGLTVLIEKFPGYQAKMRGEAEFRQSILRDTRPGDLVFSVRGGHFEILKWSKPPLAKNLSLPYLWDWQEKWELSRLTEADFKPEGARLADHRRSPQSIVTQVVHKLHEAKVHYDHAVHLAVSRNTMKGSALETMLQKFNNSGTLRHGANWYDSFYPVMWKDVFTDLDVEFYKPDPDYFSVYTFLSITIAKTRPFMIFVDESTPSYLGMATEAVRAGFLKAWRDGEAKLREALEIVRQVVPADDRMPLSSGGGRVVDDLHEASGLARRMLRIYINKAWSKEPSRRDQVLDLVQDFNVAASSPVPNKPRENFVISLLEIATRIEDVETILSDYTDTLSVAEEAARTLEYILKEKIGPIQEEVQRLGASKPEFKDFSMLYFALLSSHAQGMSQRVADAVEKLREGDSERVQGARLAVSSDPRIQKAVQGIAYFEKELEYMLSDPGFSIKSGDWKIAAGRLKENFSNAKRSAEQGRNHEAWSELKNAWGQFDVLPGGEFVIGDYAVRRRSFEELFLSWAKAADPVYAYYLMAAFAIRELDAVENKVREGDFVSRSFVIRQIENLGRRLKKLQRLVLQILATGKYPLADPSEIEAALLSIEKEMATLETSGERAVRTVYANDRNKIFANTKLDDPGVPVTSSFFRLIQEMRSYSDSRPKGARLAADPSPEIKALLERLIQTAENIRDSKSEEMRVRMALEFLDSVPFKLTVVVDAEIERLLSLEGVNRKPYREALERVQSVFSGMNAEDRAKALRFVVRSADSTRGNIILGLVRPLRENLSGARLALTDSATLEALKFSELKKSFLTTQERLDLARRERAFADQAYFAAFGDSLKGALTLMGAGGIVAYFAWHAQAIVTVFGAGLFLVLFKTRAHAKKRFEIEETLRALYQEEAALRSAVLSRFNGKLDYPHGENARLALNAVDKIVNADPENQNRPNLSKRVDTLRKKLVRYDSRSRTVHKPFSSKAHRAAVDQYQMDVERRMDALYLDAAEYVETRGASERLAADIEVFDVVGASRAIDRFLDADSRGVSSDDRFSGARLAAIDYLTGGAVSAVLYQARIWNLGRVLDSVWTSHERNGFIRKTAAQDDIRKRVGPYTIGRIDMSAKYRGTLKEISLKDFAEFSRAYGFETPFLVFKSMVRSIRAHISPPLTRQCPLCEANFPLSENAFHWKGNYRWNVTPNPFPILDSPKDRHFVIGSADHTPQVLDERSIEDMVRFAREAKNYRVFFNGIGAGASIPRHRHIQAVTYPFPIENEYYFPIETVKRDGEVFTYRVRNYPRELYAFQSSNETLLAKTIYEKISVLQAHQIPHDLLLVRQDYGPVRAYLFALNPKRRYGFSGAHQAAGYIFSPAKNAAGEPIDLFEQLDPDTYSGSPEEKEAQALDNIRGYLKDALHPIEMWEFLKAPVEDVPASTVEGARLAVDQESQTQEMTFRVEKPGKEAVKVHIQKKVDPISVWSDAAQLVISADLEGADAVSVSFDRPLNESLDTLAALIKRYVLENDLPLALRISPESEETIHAMLNRELDTVEDLYTIERDPRGVNYDQVNYFVDEFYRLLEGRIFHNHSPSDEQEKAIRKELREILEESLKNAFESIQVRFMHEDETLLKESPPAEKPAQKGEIHVYLVPKGDQLMFQIIDDGMGVHPQVLRLTEKESKNREDDREWTGGWMERWEKYYQSSIKHNHPGQFLELSGQGQGLLMIEHFSHDKLIQGTWTLKDRAKELRDKSGAIFTYHFNFNGKVAKKNGDTPVSPAGARLAKTGDYKAALDKITSSFSDGIDSFLRNPSLTEVSLESMLQYENQKITDLVPSAQRGAARKELAARIKTVLIAKNFEPTSNPDIYKVPTDVRQKLLRSQKSGARLAHTQAALQSLQQTYLKMRGAFENELKADVPSVDVIVVTAYDDRMKKLYEDHLAGLSGVTYRKDVPVLVVTNPILNGRVWSAGSGGMISRSLRAVDDALPALKENYWHLRSKTGLDDLNILIVQGGGLGERMLFSALLGSKTLTPLPVPLGDGRQATLLDMAMMAGPTYTQALAKRGQPGVVALAGDIVSITKPQLKDGLNLLGAPKTPAEIDRRLGVIAQSENGQVHFIEKPSLEQIALDPRLRNRRYLLANAANSVLTHSDRSAYRLALNTFLSLEGVMRKELEETGSLYPVDTSIDLLEPRAAGSMKEALDKRSADDDERKEYYASIYKMVREGLPGLVVPRQSPSSSYFIDFASVSDWFDVMGPESVLSQVLGRSFTSSDRAVLHKITPARGESRWKYLLFGIGRSMAYVSDDHVMLKIPVKTARESGMAIVYVDLKDRLEKTVEKGMLFGRSASHMLDSWKVPYRPYDSLLDVPAWPVVPENLMGHLAAIQGLSKGHPADLYGYLPKMSIRQIQRSLDVGSPERSVQGARLAKAEDFAGSRWIDEVTVKKDASETPVAVDDVQIFKKITERLKILENDTPDNDVRALEIDELDARVATLRGLKNQLRTLLGSVQGDEKRDAELFLIEVQRLQKEADDQRNKINLYIFSADEQRLVSAVGSAASGQEDKALQALLADAVPRLLPSDIRAFVSPEGTKFLHSENAKQLLDRYNKDLSDKSYINDGFIGKDYDSALNALRTNAEKLKLLQEIAQRVEIGDRIQMDGQKVLRVERIIKGYVLYYDGPSVEDDQEIIVRTELESGIRSGQFKLLPKESVVTAAAAGLPTDASAAGARLSVSEQPIVVGVRSVSVAAQLQKMFSDREDIEIVTLYPHADPQDTLRQLDTIALTQNSLFSILIDEEDLNEKAKVEFLKQFHKIELKARPVLRDLLSGAVEIADLSEAQKKSLVEDLSKILPQITPKSWSLTTFKTRSAEEIWMDTKLELFHPSFGTSIKELPGFADKSPRAAVWSMETILKDPLLLKALIDRDHKLAGRMRIDDYLLTATLDEDTLVSQVKEIAGEGLAELFRSRFAGRYLESTDTVNAATIAKTLNADKGYKPEYVLFVDLDEKRNVQRAKDEKAYQVLYLRSEYALTLDKVATQILAAGTGAMHLFIKGLQMDGEGNFIFSPLLPIDYERHFREFYASLKQILQSA